MGVGQRSRLAGACGRVEMEAVHLSAATWIMEDFNPDVVDLTVPTREPVDTAVPILEATRLLWP